MKIELNIDKFKTNYAKHFFRGYQAAIEDFQNALSNNLFNLVEEPIDLDIIEDDEGRFKPEISKADYDNLSTINKIKVEMFLKIAQDLLDQMNCFEIEAYQGLEEGEENDIQD